MKSEMKGTSNFLPITAKLEYPTNKDEQYILVIKQYTNTVVCSKREIGELTVFLNQLDLGGEGEE